MRAVVATDEGTLELSFMWLPTFFGMNVKLVQELQEALQDKFIGRNLTEEVLDEAHDAVVGFIEKKFPSIKGLEQYFDALKYVYFDD